MIGNTLIDNSPKLKFVDTLNEIINMPEINEICIATGYWDLKGTSLVAEALLNFLAKENAKIRLLIGKDPNIFRKDLTSEAYKSAKVYPQDYLKIDLQNVEMNNEQYQKAAKMLIDYCSGENPKIEVHIFELNENDETQFFHSKCYIFMSKHGRTCGVIGSSNFTQMGLLGNSELNFLDVDASHITTEPTEYNPAKGYYFWFNEKWALSKDWTKEFVIEIGKSPVGLAIAKDYHRKIKVAEKATDFEILTPKEIYYKVLINEFNSFIEHDGKIRPEDYIPADPDFKKLNYQLQAVSQAFGILEKHNGMILADVVGLGKTFTALMIIKRYIIESGFTKPVLIISPPAVKKNWADSIDYFDKNAKQKIKHLITVTTIGTLDTDDENFVETDDFDDSFVTTDYGMVVVDESHRFRNSGTIAYKKLEDLLFEKKPYTVLLSATPQNNRPIDILNQLYLFEHDHRHSTLTGLGKHDNNLEAYFSEKEKLYDECIKDWKEKNSDGTKNYKTPDERKQDVLTLKELADQIRDDVLNQLVIRRTRTDLQSDLYKEDIAKQGIVFPKINPPKGLPYEMTGSLAQLFAHTLDVIAPKIAHVDVDVDGTRFLDFKNENDYLHYYRYRAIEYLDSKYHKIYAYDSKRQRNAGGSVTVEGISERLASLMELHLVKRLESSRDAFEESLRNLQKNTNNMIKMFEKGRIFICPDFDIHQIINSYPEYEIEKAFEQIKEKAIKQNKKHQTQKNAEYKPTDFKKEYIHCLQNDAALISNLADQWAKNKQDKKRDTFIGKIESKFLNKRENPNQKMVVFTECIATQNMLYEYLNDKYPGQVLKITAANRKDEQETLNANFDANYKDVKQDKYKILVTTDVLAEGVNLHRANTLVNYDSPWNSTRLMQRLGRINRIGSTSKEIFSYNFYPSTLGDNQINLYKRTLVKLQAFHNMFGEDSQIYTTDEEMADIKRPEFEEAESLDPKIEFIVDLRAFKTREPEKYERLAAINKTVVAAIKLNDENYCLAKVHNSYFKVFDSDEKSFMTPNQIEFCKCVKKLCKSQEEFFSSEEFQDYKQKCIIAFQINRDNDNLSLKSKNKIGEKDRSAAIKKLMEIKKSYKLKSTVLSAFNDVMVSVRANNVSLIRKINETDCSNLLNIGIEFLLIDWHKMLSKKTDGDEPKVEIEFIVK